MKYRKLKCMVCVMFCVVLVGLLLAACTNVGKTAAIEPMESEEIEQYSFDFIGGTDVMPIVGYYGPHYRAYSTLGQKLPDYNSDEFMQMVKDCGINIISFNEVDYASIPKETKKLLDLGNKHGVGIFVTDSLVYNSMGDNALSVVELDERINNYINHPACVGVYVKDEPGSNNYNAHVAVKIADVAPIFQNLAKLAVPTYGNLFRLNSLGPDLYREYVKEYMESCPINYLSYDMYPFDEGDELSVEMANTYFLNMSIIREAAEKNHIPFWTFVQAGAQWNDEKQRFESDGYYPEEGSFHWMANTSLAYGAKGIQYFPVLQPYHFGYTTTEDLDFERNSLIGAWNNKNKWWYFAKDVSAQIAAVDEVLMNSVNKGVLLSGNLMDGHFDDVEYILEGTSWRELQDISGEAMVGCFNYRGKSAFYVVNYDNFYSQKIKLDFLDNYNMKIVQKAEESYVKADSLTLTMNAGEGVLIVIEN